MALITDTATQCRSTSGLPVSVETAGLVAVDGYNDNRLPVYAETQKRIGYGGITLVREGDYAVVKIEWNGCEIEVIREHLDGFFCHNISSLGIEQEILRSPYKTQESDSARPTPYKSITK
jgi:hypothetical protein